MAAWYQVTSALLRSFFGHRSDGRASGHEKSGHITVASVLDTIMLRQFFSGSTPSSSIIALAR